MVSQPSPLTHRLARWTQVSAIVSAALQGLADAILHPVIMLGAIIFLLGGSLYQVAIASMICGVVWSCGRFLIEPAVKLVRSEASITFAGLTLRTGAIVLLGFVGFRLDHMRRDDAIVLLILCYGAYQLGSMLTALSSNDRIAASYLPNRRARLFRWRTWATTLAAIVASLVAARTLDPAFKPFPESAGLLLVFAAVSVVASGWFLLIVPFRPQETHASILGPTGAGTILGQSAIRRFLSFRALLGLSAIADPFILVYGIMEMELSLRFVGIGLLCFTLAQGAGTLVWPRWVKERSSLRALQLASFLRLMFLLLVVAIPVFSTSTFYTDRFDTPNVASWIFAGSFGLLGFLTSIHNVANQQYLLDIGGRDASTAIALSNLVLGIVSVAPIVGAWLAIHYSLRTTIVVAASIAFLAFLSSSFVVETRVRINTKTGIFGTGSRQARTSPQLRN